MTSSTLRPVAQVTRGVPTAEGAGVRLTRLIGSHDVRATDPFLMLDHFDSERGEDYIAGFPDHPHRGFETVTYMLAGRLRHADNHGHSGLIDAGDVQWMTAGRGLIHSEMPEQADGLMRGFQLWVNLPASDKLTAPRYQEIPAARIPVEARAGGRVKVIAGATGQGTAGPVATGATEAVFLDVRLEPGAVFEETVAGDRTALLVVHGGEVEVGDGTRVGAVSLARLGPGDRVRVRAGGSEAAFLLLAGRPLGEPIAWAGPFVMNTREEVMQAFEDYREGRF